MVGKWGLLGEKPIQEKRDQDKDGKVGPEPLFDSAQHCISGYVSKIVYDFRPLSQFLLMKPKEYFCKKKYPPSKSAWEETTT